CRVLCQKHSSSTSTAPSRTPTPSTFLTGSRSSGPTGSRSRGSSTR
ncbi:MAG: hypothetical protein AVDCRST_MAG12-3615, partial [uncultured Rubrobacteraceae bacterium]